MSGNERSITDSAHGILKQEDEPAFEDVSCPILSGVGVRLWGGLEVGWHHPLQHRERATTHLGRLSTPSPRAPAGAADRDGGVFGHRRLRVRQGAEIQVIGAEILWALAPRA